MVEDAGFALRVTENGDSSVVLVSGELDLETSPQLSDCLREFSQERVTIDFSDVTFMDSTALGVLVAAKLRIEQEGGEIVLHGVQPAQMKIFEIAGLADSLNFDGDGGAPTA